MAQQVTLGGDRLGSGNKQKVELHNYQMSSFNLEQDWKSSMAPGILYPFIKLVGTNHDTFDIDLDTFVRTLPTKGPLFGSYKLQCDIFAAPFRLYQGILHNNPIDIGLKMNQVYLPKIKFRTASGNIPMVSGADEYTKQVHPSSLMKYMGFSGAGEAATDPSHQVVTIDRKINAIPFLAYYDIFKNYYSNKQEENAYVIVPGDTAVTTEALNYYTIYNQQMQPILQNVNPNDSKIINQGYIYVDLYTNLDKAVASNTVYIYANFYADADEETTLLQIEGSITDIINELETDGGLPDTIAESYLKWMDNRAERHLMGINLFGIFEALSGGIDEYDHLDIQINIDSNYEEYTAQEIKLQAFDLANIDEMRNRLLSANTLGNEFVIDNSTDLLPYSALVNTTNAGITWNAFHSNGLVVKTYQSDLFNNWLDTEWIDGTNGISALSAVSVVDNKFTMDSLNLAEKVYEVLNRIAVSGGTYEDWQEAVWGQGAVRKAETPMYMGGMAAEIMFEEVVSNSEAKVSDDEPQALGTLAGKGTQVGKRGGNNIHIKCEEPTYVIGIVSITPRICYTQGNDWDLTEIDTLNDLHKPALDGIGFQNLLVEQFAWWDHKFTPTGSFMTRSSAGKQTAWINYQTAVDKAFGDFAKQEGKSFMVLARNYEYGGVGIVSDVTTYIDPAKYNYAFAYSDLAAQNFWVQIHSKVVARRKMGAQQIPNL